MITTHHTCDAVRILVAIMRQVGTDPDDIKNALHRVKYDGLREEVYRILSE
ncbi:MAG: hypothetical protein KKF46_07855 [Nanoarchaeota archaeon]|nr:hypothetical protein [Nanoarchaeota archaeon]MBU1322242.1 hypothetical protein [Nanoarchaeota archaeon]MBU1598222.1 hypothetical protein [Nanoarchaeota archaeon]